MSRRIATTDRIRPVGAHPAMKWAASSLRLRRGNASPRPNENRPGRSAIEAAPSRRAVQGKAYPPVEVQMSGGKVLGTEQGAQANWSDWAAENSAGRAQPSTIATLGDSSYFVQNTHIHARFGSLGDASAKRESSRPDLQHAFAQQSSRVLRSLQPAELAACVDSGRVRRPIRVAGRPVTNRRPAQHWVY